MPVREPRPPRSPHQQSLFRVIPFDAIAASPAKEQEDNRPRPRRPNIRVAHPDQDFLPFEEAAAPAASKPVIECDASPAPVLLRLKAGAIDLAIVFTGACLFGAVFHAAGGRLPLDRSAIVTIGMVAGLILCAYGLVCCLLSDRSPGMRIVGLRLLHFHGRAATRKQRLMRLAAGFLSAVPAGIGYIWALLDEEHLTFHDQISGTFSSPE